MCRSDPARHPTAGVPSQAVSICRPHIVAELESTYEGCCWLLDRWYELRQRQQSVCGCAGV